MYENYYHMKSKAFPGQPNPAVFYESDVHQGAMRFLLSGVREEEPFLLLMGQYGMGKTLLGFRLAEHLQAEGYLVINVPTPVISYAKLLEQMLIKFEWTPRQQDEESLQNQLLHYLNIKGMGEHRIIVILDEIQDYDISTLVKIRMLSNYNIEGEYPFQFILFGHPTFLKILANQQLAALDQRIRRRYELDPFNFTDTREYIYFRLINSGAAGTPYFPDNAIRMIHDNSRGIPRVINNMCDACLLIGATQGLDVIDEDVVREAVSFTKIESSHDSAIQSADSNSAAREIAAQERQKSALSPSSSEQGSSEQRTDTSIGKRHERAIDFSNIQKTDRKNHTRKSVSSENDIPEEKLRKLSNSNWIPIIIIILLLVIVGVLLGFVIASQRPDNLLQDKRAVNENKSVNNPSDEKDTEAAAHTRQSAASENTSEREESLKDDKGVKPQEPTDSVEDDRRHYEDSSLATLLEEMEVQREKRREEKNGGTD